MKESKRNLVGVFSAAFILLITLILLTSCGPDSGSIGGGSINIGEHEHVFENWEVEHEATCQELGLLVSYCECGQKRTAIIPITDHTPGDWIVKHEPTCTADGFKYRTCTFCHTETDGASIKATGHTVATLEGKDASCTEGGLTEGEYCSTCKETLKAQTETPKADHTYTDEVVPPTCKEGGYTTHTCECGHIYISDTTDALKHEEVLDKAIPATCTENGLTEGSHCTVCGEVTKKQEVIYAPGHDIIIDHAISPTCTTSGATEGSHCAVCNTVLVKQDILPATGHDTSDWIFDVEPGCTTQGSKYKECNTCHITIENRLVPELGHSAVYEPSMAPTCTEDGYTSYGYCDVCGEILLAQIPIPATGHKYSSRIVNPTCEDDGYTEYTCVCGDTYRDSYTTATGHTVKADDPKSPTCTENGLTEGSHCTVCNKILIKQEIIPATGHTELIDQGSDATCTEDGITEGKHCSACGEVIISQTVIPATGHTEVINKGTSATCTTAGISDGAHCSACGEVLIAQVEIPAHGHQAQITSVSYIDSIALTNDATYPFSYSGGVYTSTNKSHSTTSTFTITALYGCDVTIIYSVSSQATYDKLTVAYGTKSESISGQKANYSITVSLEAGEKITISYSKNGSTSKYNDEGWFSIECDKIAKYESILIPGEDAKPTCTEGAYCYHCGILLKEAGHSPVKDMATLPGCEESGLTEGSHCEGCGEVFVAQEEITPIGHSYTEAYTPPTCEESGYITYLCQNCGDSSYIITDGPAGHSYGEWETVEGKTVRECTVGCGASQTILSLQANLKRDMMLTGYYVTESDVQVTAYLSDGEILTLTDFTLENNYILNEGANSVTVKFHSAEVEFIVHAITSNLPGTISIDNFTYTEKNGEITITGYVGSFSDVVIPAHVQMVPVRYISASAFENCTSITSVTIPGSVRTIGSKAFNGCTSLTEVELHEGLSTIGGQAFYGCPITSIVIPDSVTEIATIKSVTSYYGAFENCTALRTVVIGDGVSIIHRDTFHGCSSLETVTFGESLTSIYPSAFEDCDSLVSISLENNIISIGGYAFADCDRLTDLVIGDSVTTIESYAFEGCDSLKNITIGSGLTTIDTGAFSSCTAIESIDIPANVQHIGIGAFYGCSALTSLTLNEGLKTISGQAFYGCPITSLVIPDSVTEIDTIKSGTSYYGAFENCTALRTVVIGDGVSIIHRDTFHGCSSLETVTFGESLTSIYPSAFEDCDSLANICLTNKISSVGEYAFYDCDGLSNLVIGDSVTTIGDHAFESCNSLKNITIGSGLTTIGIESFRDCIGLESLVIPGNVSTIREGAFYGCTNLTYLYLEEGIKTIYGGAFYETSIISVVIPDSVTTFDIYKSGTAYYGAFEGCKNLKTVTIGSGLTVITTETFKDCISLESIYIPGNIQDIGDKAFYGCTGLSSLTLCEGIKTIGGAAFYGSSVTSLVLPDSLVKLDTYPDIDIYHGAFEDCKLLKTLVIGDGLTVITRDTFRDCVSLEYVTFGKSVVTIEKGAFYDCDSLVDLVIGDSIVTIDDYAFKNCDKLKNITFGKSVTTIDDEAFMYCISIESLYIPGNVQHIGNGAFFGCTGLSSLTFCEGIKKIEGAAFYGSSITSVVLPDSLVEINSDFSALPDDGIFEKCMLLKTVVIGDGLTVIANDTFRGCTALTSVEFGSNVQKIGQHAFAECSSLSAISLPSSMITIDDNAFMDCTRLSSIDLGCGTQRINEEAFSGCTALRAIVIPANVQVIENEAFAGCVLLHEIIIEKGLLHTVGNYVFDECRTARIYYTGTESDWANISIGEKNDYPLNDTPFFYSAHKPASVGNFWFYNDNGETVVWNITKAAHKADIYYNELLEKYGSAFDSLPYMAYRDISTDPVFIATFAAWTTLEIVINPFEQITASISQQQFYEIAIYDILMITHGSDQSLLAMSELDKKTLFEEIRNEFYDGALDDVLKAVNITEDFADFLVKKFDISNADVPSGEIISTINFLLDISENAFEATERVCNYMVLRNTKEVFLDILVEISNNTSNKKDLREAAINCVKYISASFDEAMNMVYDKMEEDSIHSAHVFIMDEAWGMLLDAAGLGGVSIAAKGISFLMDMGLNMDKAVATFYQLTAAVRFESALRKIVTPQVDYLRQENLHLAPNYNEAIRFYECAMIKGHDYTVEFYDACQTDDVDTDEIRTAKKKLAIEFDDLDASINYRYELYLGYVDSLC